MHIFCIVNVFYPFNRGLDTYLCIVSVFYLLNGGLDTYLRIVSIFYLLNGGFDIRGRELLLGYPPVSASVDSANKKKAIMSTITMIMHTSYLSFFLHEQNFGE